jgi:hypothetical protein
MNDYDDRIRRALDAQARRVSAEPEPVELTDRIARRDRRRTRALTGALVLALFAGPTLGFVAGRSDGGDRQTADDASDGVSVDEGGDRPTLPAQTFGARAPSLSAAGGAPLPETTVLEFTEAPGAWSAWGGWYGDQQLARAFVRDAGGTRVRVYRADVGSYSIPGPPWWEPPGWCFPNGYVQADVSNDDAVGIVAGSTYATFREGHVGGTLGIFGIGEGAATWVAIAQGTGDAARVRATFPGGGSDEMDLVDGIAVLVAPASVSPGYEELYSETVALEAFDAGGRSLGVQHANFGGLDVTEAAMQACAPPTELPPPGAEQPADVAAAEQAVRDAFLIAHGRAVGGVTREQQMAAIDDPAGFPEIWDEMAAGPFAEQVAAAQMHVDDVVFLSATRAAVKYGWTVPDYSSFDNRFGELVLVDGAWKVTRATMCNDFSLAGAMCE